MPNKHLQIRPLVAGLVAPLLQNHTLYLTMGTMFFLVFPQNRKEGFQFSRTAGSSLASFLCLGIV